MCRYGETPNVDDRHPLIKTISTPSSILHKHKLEILIHSLGAAKGVADSADLLVPSLATPSAAGRTSQVEFPVHKALLYIESLNDLRFIRQSDETTKEIEIPIIQGLVDGSWSALQHNGSEHDGTVAINLGLGEVAVEIFRKSIERAMDFEHAWYDSGLPGVVSFVTEGTSASASELKPSVRRLISHIAETVDRAIHKEHDIQQATASSNTVSPSSREILNEAISIWAEKAHTSLRDDLTEAFYSKSWRKTKWYKLFWRVDEISFVTSDILSRAWLVDGEHELIWLSGRIYQSGLIGPPRLRPPPPRDSNPEDEYTILRGPPPVTLEQMPEDKARPFEPDAEHPPTETLHPWHQDIGHGREALARTTIPPLQALSQKILLQTLSTVGLTSSLSALLYISISATSVYEAGAIAALGLVWSLRRMQRQWEGARRAWRDTIREEGRVVLRRAEESVRSIVRLGGYVQVDAIEEAQRQKAKVAVEKVRETLQHLEEGRK